MQALQPSRRLTKSCQLVITSFSGFGTGLRSSSSQRGLEVGVGITAHEDLQVVGAV